jgi:hypothetical protein
VIIIIIIIIIITLKMGYQFLKNMTNNNSQTVQKNKLNNTEMKDAFERAVKKSGYINIKQYKLSLNNISKT